MLHTHLVLLSWMWKVLQPGPAQYQWCRLSLWRGLCSGQLHKHASHHQLTLQAAAGNSQRPVNKPAPSLARRVSVSSCSHCGHSMRQPRPPVHGLPHNALLAYQEQGLMPGVERQAEQQRLQQQWLVLEHPVGSCCQRRAWLSA